MVAATERFNEICRANADAAQQSANFAMESLERMVRLQAEAARGFYAEGTRQFLEFISSDPAKSLAHWPRLMERNLERTMELTRAWVNGTTEFQNDLAGIVREQLPAINRNIIQGVEQLTQFAAAQTKAAMEAEAKRATGEAEHRAKKMAA
jgi:hypothetical protein